MSPDRKCFNVSIVAMPQVSALSLFGAFDEFRLVGRMWEMLNGEPVVHTPFRPQIVAQTLDPIPASGGALITPDLTFEMVDDTDLVYVPSLFGPAGDDPSQTFAVADLIDAEAPDLPGWIRQMHDGGAIVCSICTGSFALAEAGLLKDQPATTHWAAMQKFAADYPDCLVDERAPLIVTGEGDRIVMGGTTIFWSDLILYLVQRLCGAEEAHKLAKASGIFWKGGSHDVIARTLENLQTDDRTIRECQSWLAENYAETNPVEKVLARTTMTERTLTRRFKKATGKTPIEYVHALRIEKARDLLERFSLPVEEIATRVGYADVSYFRRLFRRKMGLSPGTYRRNFKLPPRLPGQSS